jgi:SAM-dependent methyltransferase
MSRDERARLDRALLRARASAYGPGEFVGQESFMGATQILSLAAEAGVGPGVSVLDVCCGVAGPGRFITAELGCTYTGVDLSADAVGIARERAGDLPCRFEVARVPPVPAGPFDVVLLLETMLAFPDKDPLLRDVHSALAPGGSFAFTLEEGRPLTQAERDSMPEADTVWPVPLADMLCSLERAGLRVRWQADLSLAHRATAEALTGALVDEHAELARRLGRPAVDDLLAAHRLWSHWLRSGRVRKFAVVAERPVEAASG